MGGAPRGAVTARAAGVLLAAGLCLLLAGAIALALQGGGSGAPESPSALTRAPTPSPSPTTPGPLDQTEPPVPAATPTPSPTPTPTPTPLDGPAPEGIEDIAAQVAALRGLPLDEPLDARLVSSDALGAKFAELAFDDLDPEQIQADQRLLAALRLIDRDVDLVALIEALYREQILGLYALEEKVLYIGGDDPVLTEYQQITAAHEVLHALQDRAYDLQSMLDLPERESDASLARSALVEGDATLTQELWSVNHQSDAERARAAEQSRRPPSTAYLAAPGYVREAINFPYREGAAFVTALYQEGGWEAVDAAFADPPTTTRQILDPKAYMAGEGPVSVTAVSGPSGAWETGPVYTFGEFEVRHLLQPLGTQRAHSLASGWRGGETRAWGRGEDDAVSLVLSYGSPGQADAACEASPAWYEAVTHTTEVVGEGAIAGDHDVFAWTCDGLEVRWGIAPDAETALILAEG